MALGSSCEPHLAIGRGSFPGPLTGGYISWNFGPFNVAADVSAVIQAGFKAPCALRLEALTATATGFGGTAATLFFEKNTTYVAGGTSLISTASLDFDGGATAAIGHLITMETSPSLSLVSGVRDIAQGDFVMATVTTVASTITAACVSFYFTVIDHVNVDPVND